jgi:hypothetical protein
MIVRHASVVCNQIWSQDILFRRAFGEVHSRSNSRREGTSGPRMGRQGWQQAETRGESYTSDMCIWRAVLKFMVDDNGSPKVEEVVSV